MVCSKEWGKLSVIVYPFLRIVIGVIMAVHGWGKLNSLEQWTAHVEKMGIPFPEISAYLGVAGEFLGGLGLIAGLFTPVAAFGVFCTMLVAIFAVHWKNGLLAKNGGFEYPLSLMMISLYFIFQGGGRWSLDHILSRRFCKNKN